MNKTKKKATQNDKLKHVAETWNNIEKFPKISDVATHLNITERSVFRLIAKAKAAKIKVIPRKLVNAEIQDFEKRSDNKTTRENMVLKMQVKELREQLELSHADAISNERLVNIIRQASEEPAKPDKGWLTFKSKTDKHKSIAVLFLSDLHFDEVVVPSQVEYVNSYSRSIASSRIKAVFNNALSLLTKKIKADLSGVVVALGGDLLSGNIHEELAETNDATILESILELTNILHTGISAMADNFGNVFVPCVVGNHGRIHKKPRFKYRVQQNYEWIIYQLLCQRFALDKRVTFEIPESSDVSFKIFNVNFLLTHGDQFKGGSGISGIFTPLMLGASRKQKRQVAVQKPFDVMMVGHFHSYIHTNSLIVNGSVKGYDEFAYGMNFPFEVPQQALFLVHEEHGVTIRMPVICN
ncbi:MAG: hypothetical protein ACO3FL_04450 [Ilumatobacteraceae bacterium]